MKRKLPWNCQKVKLKLFLLESRALLLGPCDFVRFYSNRTVFTCRKQTSKHILYEIGKFSAPKDTSQGPTFYGFILSILLKKISILNKPIGKFGVVCIFLKNFCQFSEKEQIKIHYLCMTEKAVNLLIQQISFSFFFFIRCNYYKKKKKSQELVDPRFSKIMRKLFFHNL